MKIYMLRALALVLVLAAFAAGLASCDSGAGNTGVDYTVTAGGVTLRPDLAMDGVLASITESHTYSESSACPPFDGKEKLYDFTSVKITTYEKNGKDYIMGIFLKDDSVNVSGVSIGSSVEDMKTALGESYEEAGIGTYVYTAKDGSALKCIVKNGAVASIQLLTKEADS